MYFNMTAQSIVCLLFESYMTKFSLLVRRGFKVPIRFELRFVLQITR